MPILATRIPYSHFRYRKHGSRQQRVYQLPVPVSKWVIHSDLDKTNVVRSRYSDKGCRPYRGAPQVKLAYTNVPTFVLDNLLNAVRSSAGLRCAFGISSVCLFRGFNQTPWPDLLMLLVFLDIRPNDICEGFPVTISISGDDVILRAFRIFVIRFMTSL